MLQVRCYCIGVCISGTVLKVIDNLGLFLNGSFY